MHTLFDKLTRFIPVHLQKLMGLLSAMTIIEFIAAAVGYGKMHISYAIIWNLFLAWLPLLFAILILFMREKKVLWPVCGVLGFLWLIFFPNAPYLWTDLLHLRVYTFATSSGYLPDVISWYSLLYLVIGALIGSLFGSLSLYFLHKPLENRFGKIAGWLFVFLTGAASGVAIYIGRFPRFNSWDLFSRPLYILETIFSSLGRDTFILYFIFFSLTVVPYLLFYICADRQETQVGDILPHKTKKA